MLRSILPRRWPRRWPLWIFLGLALRLVFIVFPRPIDDDTWDYLQLGRNLLHNGVYGMGSGSGISPTMFRLPAYPIFLAVFEQLFARFWPNNWLNAVFLAQTAADLASCLLIAAFARRHLSPRAAEFALALAALCPFTAVYAAIALTESLSIFAVALGIYSAGRALAAESAGLRDLPALLLAALASALAALLRPDGILLFASLAAGLFFYTLRARAPRVSSTATSSPIAYTAPTSRIRTPLRRALAVTSFFCCIALAPTAFWTLRNWIDFRVFQPLAPRYIDDPGELPLSGAHRWLRTWSVEFVSTANVAWNLPGGPIDPVDIPASACDSPQQRAQTVALIAEYNRTNSISPDLDRRFAALARDRIHAHPFRYYVVFPLERVADMLFRPRTEAFYLEVFWWQWSQHPAQSAAAILLGLIDLFYVAAAAFAFLRGRVPWRWMLGGYLVLRLALLGAIENPEPRYTLECFPIFIVAAAAALAQSRPIVPPLR